MKKFNTILVGLFILFAAVFLSAYSLRQKTMGKPSPAPIWGARIPFYGNLSSLSGDQYLYKTGDPFARVTAQKGRTGYSTIHFFIYGGNPPENNAQFSGVNMTDWVSGSAGPTGFCGFPAPYNSWESPDCLVGFFNSDHPKAGYEHLLFYFVVGADIEDLNTFPIGIEKKWTGPGSVTIYLWNSFEALTDQDPEPYYSVTADLKNLCSDGEKGYWIKRVDDKTWEIRIEQQVFDVSEHYSWAETVIGKNGRPTTITTSYTPLKGKANLSYKIRLIKNPS
jgi:hypothetical protein